MLSYNPILASDSYKLSHPFAFSPDVSGIAAYIEARTGGKDIIVPVGLSIYIQRYLSKPITMADINEAEKFAEAHGEPFKREMWEIILNKYHGYLPVTVRAVPEGTPVPSGNALVSITCTDPDVYQAVMHIEAALQRAVWYPTTIASKGYALKKTLRRFYNNTCESDGLLDFALHDFGARGVTCHEQAEIGGFAHLVNFKGSDTMEGVRAANYFYKEPMSGFSVAATEHSVQCSFGSSAEEENEYLDHILTTFAKPGKIVSIVIDGYDVYRATKSLCTTFRQKIINSGAKVVFRPDSGDLMEIVPWILKQQEDAFGFVMNSKGFKQINNVGIIQGDGVDNQVIENLLTKITGLGYAADSVIFGSGGALLQKLNRDTYKFAQKASAITKGEYSKWVGISKNPITDPGKSSKEGVLSLFKSRLTGEYMTFRTDDKIVDGEWEDVMQTVYHIGFVQNLPTLQEVRERCKV